MEINTAKKYLNFVSDECERHLLDGNVSDDELNQLIIEFNRFRERITESNLPEEIKKEIRELTFDYNVNKVKRSSFLIILSILTFGTVGYLLASKRQSNRIRTLENLQQSVSSLEFKIKLNY